MSPPCPDWRITANPEIAQYGAKFSGVMENLFLHIREIRRKWEMTLRPSMFDLA